jgi:hypothetical protein
MTIDTRINAVENELQESLIAQAKLGHTCHAIASSNIIIL